MIYIVLIALSVVLSAEFINPLARSAGVRKGSLAAGIIVQNSLAVLSRVFSMIMLPLLGLLSDTGALSKLSPFELNIAFWIIPVVLISIFLIRKKIQGILYFAVLSVIQEGKLKIGYKKIAPRTTKSSRANLRNFYFVILVSYIPYFIAWPITISCIYLYPEYRATLLSLSTTLTGVNTLLITFWIDPIVGKLAKYTRSFEKIMENIIGLKLVASLTASIIMTVCIMVYTLGNH